jgi:hypothetical protein
MKAEQEGNTSIAEVDVEKTTSREGSNPDTSTGSIFEIDPEKEAAVRHKFDRYVLPVTFIFMILAVLDRNNVRACCARH